MGKLKYISIFIFLFIFFFNAEAQRCDKKKLATKEMKGEYDYRDESVFVEMANGQEVTFNIILYSKQNYRLFVAAEQKLGDYNYQIIVSRKQFSRVMKRIDIKKVTLYKKDPSGFFLYDNNGKRIAIGESMVPDTVWARETTDIDELVFDSKTSESPYWHATPTKTQKVTVKVTVDPAMKVNTGCIGIYVGREYANAYQFRR